MAYDSTKHFNNFGQNTSTNTHRATRNDIRVANNTMKPLDPFDNAAATTSTNIFVLANGCTVGMIQNFTVNEQRQVNKLQAIGWEGVVQAVPGNTNGGTLNISRIALYESSIWNALGLTTNGIPFNELGTKVYDYKDGNDSNNWDSATHVNEPSGHKTNTRLVFKTLKDQKVPLEIQVKTRREGSDEQYYVETYIDCWLQSYQKSYTVQNITVAETATVSYADVY
jgi:hypothetical protein